MLSADNNLCRVPDGTMSPCDRNVSSRKGSDAARSPRTQRLAMVSGSSGRQALRLDPVHRSAARPCRLRWCGPTALRLPPPKQIACAANGEGPVALGGGRPCGCGRGLGKAGSATASANDPACIRSTTRRLFVWLISGDLLLRGTRCCPGKRRPSELPQWCVDPHCDSPALCWTWRTNITNSRRSPSSSSASTRRGRALFGGPSGVRAHRTLRGMQSSGATTCWETGNEPLLKRRCALTWTPETRGFAAHGRRRRIRTIATRIGAGGEVQNDAWGPAQPSRLTV